MQHEQPTAPLPWPAGPAGRIVVVDSGVGGLTVVRAIREALPGLAVTYVADNEAFPYGGIEEADLVRRIRDVATGVLAAHGGDALVVACNTASTVVLDDLRARLDVPVVGVVPPIKPAAALSRTRVIGLLATAGTARRSYVDDLIRTFAGDCRVVRVGSPLLAPLAEDRMRDRPVSRELVRGILAPLFEDEGAPVDAVALGCTHYPLLLDVFRDAAPREVHWIDPAPAVARRLANVLAALPARPAAPGGDRMLFTADPGRIGSLSAFLAGLGFDGHAVWTGAGAWTKAPASPDARPAASA
ncbi:glutamate racemase [Arenibaculum sp.]|jgi:glutamate racemase|uniref:glutamate racemase n=1 Tax=Arenibaculum sp. TaxID=2865862 RepID=UPI002E15F9DB|nr:glutamate racemase [Arenibaculum sp.]